MSDTNTILTTRYFVTCIHDSTAGSQIIQKNTRNLSYSFLSYGEYKAHTMNSTGEIETEHLNTPKTLYDMRRWKNTGGMGMALQDSRVINFNSLSHRHDWAGRLLSSSETTIQSNGLFAFLVCFEGSCTVNESEMVGLSYARMQKDVEYNISIQPDCYIGIFEGISANAS